MDDKSTPMEERKNTRAVVIRRFDYGTTVMRYKARVVDVPAGWTDEQVVAHYQGQMNIEWERLCQDSDFDLDRCKVEVLTEEQAEEEFDDPLYLDDDDDDPDGLDTE
jgi:hypothetical protein